MQTFCLGLFLGAMIGMAFEYGEGTVDLFGDDDTNQRVREGERAE